MFRWLNEYFNSTVWCLAPQHLNCGFKLVEVASLLAVVLFDERNFARLVFMKELQVTVISRSINYYVGLYNELSSH